MKEIKLEKSTTKIEEIKMPKVLDLSEMSLNELKSVCDMKGLTYKKVGEAKTVLIEKIEKSNLGNISLNNKTISPEIVNRVDENIPNGFIDMPIHKKRAEDEMQCYNGRFYKTMPNGYGMWIDNGVAFDLNIIK